MLTIPEILLFNIVNLILKYIKDNCLDPYVVSREKLLYILLNTKKFESLDYYQQAYEIFTRKDDHTRKIGVNLSFNARRVSIPTIHITLPSENAANDGLSIDEDYQAAIFKDIEYEDGTTATFRKGIYTRSFNSQYSLIITTDNVIEGMIIYHVLRACIVSFMEHLEFAGLRNVKISGQDIRINSESTPNLFMRGINLNFFYEVNVPQLFSKEVLSKLIIEPTPNV